MITPINFLTLKCTLSIGVVEYFAESNFSIKNDAYFCYLIPLTTTKIYHCMHIFLNIVLMNFLVLFLSNFLGKTILGELQVDELSERASQAFNRGLELRDNLFVDTGGIYLHSEPIPHDATVVSVRSFGYIKDEILSHLFFSEDDTLAEGSGEVVGAFATLYVLVYRPDQEGREYSLVHGPNETTHQLTPAILPESSGALGWEVKKGDMIGVFIPDSCEAFDFGLTRVLKACPSQVNFVTLPLECLSALYSPLVGDSAENVSRTISASDFEEVQLRLNLEVTLTAEGMYIYIYMCVMHI